MILTPLDELLLYAGATVLVALLLGRRVAAGWMVTIGRQDQFLGL